MRTLRAALLLTLLCVTPAFAVWPVQGKRVMLVGFQLTMDAELVTLPDGSLVLRGSGKGSNSNSFKFQKVSADGDLAPLWPVDGAVIGQISAGVDPPIMGWAVDSAGTLWTRSPNAGSGFQQPTVSRFSASGSPLGSTLLTTLSISTFSLGLTAGPDGQGVYGFFSNRLRRVLANGTLAPGWPTGGAVVGFGNNGGRPQCLPDGQGGVIAMAASFFPPAVQRMDSTGVRHAGWPSTGIVLTNDPLDAEAGTVPGSTIALPAMVPSGDHVIAVWGAPNALIRHLKAQRIGISGVIDPSWPLGGRIITPEDSLSDATAFSDGAGGLYATWYVAGRPYAAHVLADGTVYTTALTRPGDTYTQPRRNPFYATLIPAAVTTAAGLAFAWDESASGSSIRVRWFKPDLTLDPREPAEGRVIPTADANKTFTRAVHGAPDGGVYVVWEQVKPGAATGEDNGELWMTRLDPTPIGAGVTPTSNPLALSAPRPNPARGSTSFELTLPDYSAARLELLDLAGRVVQTRSVAGAGRHAITFDALDRVSPGLYFVRAVARTGVSTSRVVVSR